MKIRLDFVTNSSSSSFIITNNSNETIDKYDFARMLFEKLYKDVENFCMPTLAPGESCEVECTDHPDENALETYIHNNFDSDWWQPGKYFMSDKIKIEYHESHH